MYRNAYNLSKVLPPCSKSLDMEYDLALALCALNQKFQYRDKVKIFQKEIQIIQKKRLEFRDSEKNQNGITESQDRETGEEEEEEEDWSGQDEEDGESERVDKAKSSRRTMSRHLIQKSINSSSLSSIESNSSVFQSCPIPKGKISLVGLVGPILSFMRS